MVRSDVPPNLVLTARLSSSIANAVSISYIILSSISLAYYATCGSANITNLAPSDVFWSAVTRVYLEHKECPLYMGVPGLTQSYTMAVLVGLTLGFSTLNLITSITLYSVINNKKMARYIDLFVFAYVGTWLGTLVVDLTLGTHLGMDITYLTNEMNNSETYNPLLELLRHGAIYLMSISLKLYVVHIIQLVLICLMFGYLYNNNDVSKKNEHSVFKVGTINAFDPPRRIDDSWATASSHDMYAIDEFNRGREPQGIHRSDSWNHQGTSSMQTPPSSSLARPFSYLEEVRRPPPLKPPPLSPRPPQSPWAMPSLRVPEPDYSPHSPRRLKSALKTNMY